MKENKQQWLSILPHEDFVADELEIEHPHPEFHYLVNVLRLKIGEMISVANTKGTIATAKVSRIAKKTIVCEILKRQEFEIITPRLNLWVGAPKGSALEELVELTSALCVDKLILFQSKRSQNSNIKIEKLNRIAEETIRVSKNPWVMDIRIYDCLKTALSEENLLWKHDNGISLIADEMCDLKAENLLLNRLHEVHNPQIKHVNIVIGAEAGFAEEEKQSLSESSFLPTTLGPHILRVPHAAVASASIFLQLKNQTLYR